VHIAQIRFVDRGFESIAPQVFDGKDWHAGTRQGPDIRFLFGHHSIEGGQNMGVSKSGARLIESGLRLSLPRSGHVAACLRGLVPRLYLIEFLRTD
jgi:hypothetical protein